jgi:hypothetical protein
MENFVNGFDSWTETFFEVVDFITTERDKYISDGNSDYPTAEINETFYVFGHEGLTKLAIEWTNEFEKLHEDEEWDELDFYETVDAFCKIKNTL